MFDKYTNELLGLAKSIVFKSSTMAYLLSKIGNDDLPTDKKLWKYYMNLNGSYHQTDTPIIFVYDNTNITLTKTFLNNPVNNKLKTELKMFGKLFKDLVKEFNVSPLLIMGMVYDIDINEAIDAEDGDILAYDKAYLERRETNIIPKIENYIKNYLARYFVSDFTVIDQSYAAGVMSVLYSNLPIKIANFRVDNINTNYVHSYHVRLKLASNFNLSKAVTLLGNNEAMYLYRNIEYIKANVGRDEIITDINNNIIIPSNHTLYKVTMTGARPIKVDTGVSTPLFNPINTGLTYYNIFKDKLESTVGKGDTTDSLLALTGKEPFSNIYNDKLDKSTKFGLTPTKVLNVKADDKSTNIPLHSKFLLDEIVRISNTTTFTYEFENPTTHIIHTLDVKGMLALIFGYSSLVLNKTLSVNNYVSHSYYKQILGPIDTNAYMTDTFRDHIYPVINKPLTYTFNNEDEFKEYITNRMVIEANIQYIKDNIHNPAYTRDVDVFSTKARETIITTLGIGNPITYLGNLGISIYNDDSTDIHVEINKLIAKVTGVTLYLNDTGEITEFLEYLVTTLTSYTLAVNKTLGDANPPVKSLYQSIISDLNIARVDNVDILCLESINGTPLVNSSNTSNTIIINSGL